MFKERGYAATSMRHLANEVGIEAASLYNHISSKEEILQDICFDIAGQFVSNVDVLNSLSMPPHQKLLKAIELHVQVVVNNIDASAVFFHEWRFLDKENMREFVKMREKYEAAFYTIVKDGMQRGDFKKIQPKIYCQAMFSALNGIYLWYRPDGGSIDSNELGKTYGLMLLHGLKA